MNKIGKTAHEGLLSRWKFDIITQKSAQMQKKQEEKNENLSGYRWRRLIVGSTIFTSMFKKYGDTIRIINVDCLTYAGNLENLKDIEDKENLYSSKLISVTERRCIRPSRERYRPRCSFRS